MDINSVLLVIMYAPVIHFLEHTSKSGAVKEYDPKETEYKMRALLLTVSMYGSLL